MDDFTIYVSKLVYGTGGEAVVSPNYLTWLSDTSHDGEDWLTYHTTVLLPAYEGWLASNHLPPLLSWDGRRPEPWEPGSDIPLPNSLDGSFTGVSSLNDLGDALRSRYGSVGVVARELSGQDNTGSHPEKSAFSYRFWGYVKFCDALRRRFLGEIVVPPAVVYDRDGTILSPVPFCDVFNLLHANWHGSPNGPPTATGATPTLDTSAGQFVRAGGVGMDGGEEFIEFHRDHVEIFSRWLDRTGQPPVQPVNMYNGGAGWPSTTGSPSTWVEADDDPWINTEGGDTDDALKGFANVNELGSDMNSGIHGPGHTANADIRPLAHNNYVPRFHAWHGWIDNQYFWRAPRFARYNATTKQREQVFDPVLDGGAPWSGLQALTIVRRPDVTADSLAPLNGITGWDPVTGSGTLSFHLLVTEPYGRPAEVTLTAEVFNDPVDDTTPVETVVRTLAPADFTQGVEFDTTFDFTQAFRSDDPSRANPAVGFVNSRIQITGTIRVADGSDDGFIHQDTTALSLVQEKSPPKLELFFDISTFGEDQVNSAMASGEARFNSALIVTVQDQTTMARSITWPGTVADEVKGLLVGRIPTAGLFRDEIGIPNIALTDGSSPVDGVRFEPAGPAQLEDPALPDSLPQRFTYRFDAVFDTGHAAFNGLAVGASRTVSLTAEASDRCGNRGAVNGSVKFSKAANPYMRDGSPSWLSIDTRVFRLFESESQFGVSLNPADPHQFIQQVLDRLNTPGADLGGDTFDGLPTNQGSSALEYSETVSNPSAGTSRRVFNFSLAKVRLQGAGGANRVRAFFRLFRHTSTNMIFDGTTRYRTHDAGGGTKVPLLGFESTSAGADLVSIPFFATPRVGATASMTTQTDALNVKDFPTGIADEQVIYFGVLLDFNLSGTRLPAEYIAAHPDGGFSVSELQSAATLMRDAHQCMAVEINYDTDPTDPGATPANSDNLAQRNLMILTTDNPGAPITHSVQHSFEVDLGQRDPDRLGDGQVGVAPIVTHATRGTGLKARTSLAALPDNPLVYLPTARFERMVHNLAVETAMNTPKVKMSEWKKFVPEATETLRRKFPLTFDSARWVSTSDGLDELMISWPDLPEGTTAELYLPTCNCEHVLNLRHLRHAPDDVRLVDSHTLSVVPRGVSFLPLPPTRDSKIPGLITIELPKGIRKGQRWQVDVVQLRGGTRELTGGFQIDIQVKTAETIAHAELRLLELMHRRLSLTPYDHRWRPVLERRVATLRRRAKALAESAGESFVDPTTYPDPKRPDDRLPIRGEQVRVILERIRVLDDLDTFIKGAGELKFRSRVATEDNGGQLQEHRFPAKGVFEVDDCHDNQVILNQVVFDGFVDKELRVELTGTEMDTFDPDDTLGKYSRIFCGKPSDWYGAYGPSDEKIDPEHLISWEVEYRIERG